MRPEIKHTWNDHDYQLDDPEGFLDVSIEVSLCPAVPTDKVLEMLDKLYHEARAYLVERD